MSESIIRAPQAHHKRHEPKDFSGSVTFDRSYRADIRAVMQHVTDVRSYIDTVEFYIGGLWPKRDDFKSLLAEIKEAQRVRLNIKGYKLPWIQPVIWREQAIGWRYMVNVPTKQTLLLLDDLVEFPNVDLHRVDPSFDFITDSAYRANAVRLHMIRHLILRWCRSPYMPDESGETTYWAKYRGPKHKRPTRNAVGYCDRSTKMGGAFAFHLDTRSIGAPAVRRMGVKTPGDLLKLNPAQHFEKQFILAGDCWDQIEELRKTQPRLGHLTQNFRAQLLNKYCREFDTNRVDLSVLRLPSEFVI